MGLDFSLDKPTTNPGTLTPLAPFPYDYNVYAITHANSKGTECCQYAGILFDIERKTEVSLANDTTPTGWCQAARFDQIEQDHTDNAAVVENVDINVDENVNRNVAGGLLSRVGVPDNVDLNKAPASQLSQRSQCSLADCCET